MSEVSSNELPNKTDSLRRPLRRLNALYSEIRRLLGENKNRDEILHLAESGVKLLAQDVIEFLKDQASWYIEWGNVRKASEYFELADDLLVFFSFLPPAKGGYPDGLPRNANINDIEEYIEKRNKEDQKFESLISHLDSIPIKPPPY